MWTQFERTFHQNVQQNIRAFSWCNQRFIRKMTKMNIEKSFIFFIQCPHCQLCEFDNASNWRTVPSLIYLNYEQVDIFIKKKHEFEWILISYFYNYITNWTCHSADIHFRIYIHRENECFYKIQWLKKENCMKIEFMFFNYFDLCEKK